MNKIVLFSASLAGGGAERVMITIANRLVEQKKNVTIILAQNKNSYLNELDERITIVNFNCKKVITSFLPLVCYLKANTPDILLSTQTYVNVIAIVSVKVSLIKAKIFIREAITPSQNEKSFYERLINKLAKYLYPYSYKIIAPSKGVKVDLIKKFKLNKRMITVIPNPLNIGFIQKSAAKANNAANLNNEDKYIVAIGRLHPQKDYPLLLKSFAIVLKTVESKLIIMGEGPEKNTIIKLAERLNIRKYIQFTGFVDNPFYILSRCNLYVLSSKFEGLPNSMLHAAVLGIPIVATDCLSGPREILANGKWGKLVNVGSINGMANAMIDGLAGKIRPIPFSVVKEKYDDKLVVKKYYNEFSR